MAVVAVDPSSPITGGALLGDRVRMQSYAGDPDVFIRSMASRGHAGGLASTTTAAAAVLDAAGFDLVLIETVGTGQSEVEVAAAADTTVVLEAPEMGDEVQAIKAGLLEVADLVVVNKGDKPGALRTASQLRAMLVPTVGRGHRVRIGRPRSAPRSVWSRPPRRARACPSCSPRSTGTGRPRDSRRAGGARLAATREAQVWAILGERLARRWLRDPERATLAAESRPRRGRRPPARPVLPPPIGCSRRSLMDRPMTTSPGGTAALHARVRRAVRGRARVLHVRAAWCCPSRRGSPPARSVPMRPASASPIGAFAIAALAAASGRRLGRRTGSAGGRCCSPAGS